MAHVDNLIERIPDPHLRAQIAEEVAKLVEHKDFGLVFQRHLPEDLEVPGTRPRRGDIVRLRADPEKHNHVVLATKDGRATIIAVDAAKQTIDGSESATVDHDQLVVVKDFSVPIYPGLAPLGEVNRGGDKPTHIVIEGENYYALETLLYTHERKIDLIYIDPPYNTGTSTWIYNDRFVGDLDAYRHSKWLSFMERRLRHAKRLLKDTGVLIVAIDDAEQARLKSLLDQEFGERNFIANLVWQGGRKNDSRYVSTGHDYMLVYAKSEATLAGSGARWREQRPADARIAVAAARAWEDSAHDPLVASRAMKAWIAALPDGDPAKVNNRFYEFEPDGRVFRKRDISWPGGGGPTYDVRHPVTGLPVPVPSRGWIYSKPERMQEDIDADLILWGKDHTEYINRKTYLEGGDGMVPTSVFEKKRTSAAKHLESVLGSKDFPYPKDVEVISRWLDLASGGSPDAIFLDFFVGTGTTVEAVMRLNAEDGGSRQAIAVTNNELSAKTAAALRKAGCLPGDPEWEAEGVFQKVTRPRVETIVTGIRPDGSTYSDGLDENVAFLKLTYEDENLIALGRRFDAVAPLLWLKAGGVGPVVRRRGDALWALPSGAIYGVLFAPAQAKAFAELIAVHDRDLRHLFVVTDSESEFQEAVAYLPLELRLETTRLYADYLHSFEINGKG